MEEEVKDEKITLPWCNEFRSLLTKDYSETEIIKRFREYMLEKEHEINEAWQNERKQRNMEKDY